MFTKWSPEDTPIGLNGPWRLMLVYLVHQKLFFYKWLTAKYFLAYVWFNVSYNFWKHWWDMQKMHWKCWSDMNFRNCCQFVWLQDPFCFFAASDQHSCSWREWWCSHTNYSSVIALILSNEVIRHWSTEELFLIYRTVIMWNDVG